MPIAYLATLVVALAAGVPAGAAEPGGALAPPDVKASAAILVDAVSGQVLFEKSADAQRQPASTTKIMTAILLLENTQPDEVIVADKQAAETEGSSLNLKSGERVTAHDMLYALMLRSANDGCVAVAEHIAGSEARFAEMMTERAREIGATRTVFRNCNGLPMPGHVSTARDLATLARFASRYPEFNRATATRFYTIRRDRNKADVLLKNHAKFLWHFPGADGVKTGYTNRAGRCFVGGATWNGWRLISVVLNSPDPFPETARLMKYGFYHFEARRLAEAGQEVARVAVRGGAAESVPATVDTALQAVLRRGGVGDARLVAHAEPLAAPVAAGARLGRVDVVVDGRVTASAPLLAAQAVGPSLTASVAGRLGGRPIVLLLFVGVIWYARTAAKGPGIRRSRVKALLRNTHRRG